MSRSAEWLSLPIIFGSMALAPVVTEARSEAVTLQALAEWSPPHPTDVSCEWGKPMNGQRQMFCRQIYSDGSSDTYWQPVTIKDGAVAVLEEE